MRSRLGSIVGWILAPLPTLMVLGSVAVVAYWGHSHEWRAPKFSSLWDTKEAAAPEDWCEKHNVPDAECVACHPELVGGDAKDWCKEHGVPESKCTTCHPELKLTGKIDDWCSEHGVPESQCTLCHPEIAVRKATGTSPSEATVSAAPAQAPDPRRCQTHLSRVQFASEEAVRKAGIQVAAVGERPFSAFVKVNGVVDYDRSRYARLAARVPGMVWRMEKTVGQPVRKGEVVALIDAAEVGKTKAEFLQAANQVEVKTQALGRLAPGTVPDRQIHEAEASLREARSRLFTAQQALLNLGMPIRAEDVAGLSESQLARRIRFLGLPDSLAERIEQETTTANLIPIVSPLDGQVIEREAVSGEVVDSTRPLLVVADPAQRWLNLDARVEDVASLRVGQPVLFSPDGDNGEAIPATLSWISTAVDEKTRTVRVRAEAANLDGRLRANLFGTGRIRIRDQARAVAVPTEAIQWEGCCHVVFVQFKPTLFQTRKVRLGQRSGGFTEILVGVLPGEPIVTGGSHVLKAELLRANLGSGCGDD